MLAVVVLRKAADAQHPANVIGEPQRVQEREESEQSFIGRIMCPTLNWYTIGYSGALLSVNRSTAKETMVQTFVDTITNRRVIH